MRMHSAPTERGVSPVLASLAILEMESTVQVRIHFRGTITVKLMLIHSVANDNKRSIVVATDGFT